MVSAFACGHGRGQLSGTQLGLVSVKAAQPFGKCGISLSPDAAARTQWHFSAQEDLSLAAELPRLRRFWLAV
jgi:hypothetical protein